MTASSTHTSPTNLEQLGATADEIVGLIAQLSELDLALTAALDPAPSATKAVDPVWAASARNLVQYLALRQRDLRPLQMELSELGLSSLGRSEGSIQASIQTVLTMLHALLNTPDPVTRALPPVSLADGNHLLHQHTDHLLGAKPAGRPTRIMVTASTELATDRKLIGAMLDAGMDILRVNCAHDDPAVWSQIIQNLRNAEHNRERAHPCSILMDLAGPKLRTGPIEQGPPVTKLRPQSDAYGAVRAPARVLLASELPETAGSCLMLAADWLETLQAEDVIRFSDARGRNRTLRVSAIGPEGIWAEGDRTAYVVPGIKLTLQRTKHSATVRDVAPVRTRPISLRAGDELVLTRSLEPGRNATLLESGAVEPARIGCTLPDVFDVARVGEPVWFDDGTIGGIIERASVDELLIRITQAAAGGSALRPEKGINFPETRLEISPLTPKDLHDLAFVVEHADMIGYSFVNKPQDVTQLHREIEALGSHRPGVVLKIETRRAFAELPQMLLEAMRWPRVGIMLARGDLAVEVGFQRLAEVQEEILWLAGAGHVPIIWATQVLESLAKSGVPSRSEITDAAMGERAECVMLNKGPYISQAIAALDDILRRMADHQRKNRSLLRQLKTWTHQ